MTTSTDVLDHSAVETSSNRTSGRRVAPRSSLPSGRAVVGGLLVALAALGTFIAYRDATEGPTTLFVVAAGDVDPGARLGPSDLRLESMQLPHGVDASAFPSIDELDGAVALAPIRAGELVQAGAIVPPGAGESESSPPSSEFSFAVERTRALNGALNRGERIDVLATYGSGDTARTHVVARNALVTDINNEVSDTIGSASTVTVTLALPSPNEVLEAAHATQVAQITLVRATKSAPETDEQLDVFAGPDGVVSDPDPNAGTGAP
jgi:Flp pilus assembly protein CpaB